MVETMQKRINELKAENKKLKEENVKLLFSKGTLVEFCNKLTQIIDGKKESENKLLQTLQEIKEIAEQCMNKDICYDCEYVDDCYIEDAEIPTYDICKLLIQKITNERNN